MKLRIGDLSFDVGRRLLQRGAEPVHLSPKAFQLLSLLLSRRPDAVARAEILSSLWPDPAAEGSLAPLVRELRHALGEGSHGSWVRTVHGFGYAFDGSVQEAPDAVRHVLVRGCQEVELEPGGNLLGREREATVRIGHPSVAREHAFIQVTGDHAVLENLSASGATFRGADAVGGSVVLRDGDVVRVGEVALVYRMRPAAHGG